MKTQTAKQLLFSIRALIVTFIVFLVLSGVTAFPLETELEFLTAHATSFPIVLQEWLAKIYMAIKTTNAQYPQLSYGSDWLAFSHIVIATVFIGPLMDPVRNIWVIRFGMIACVMVFPLALIAGPIREIPFYWQMIDCSFGVFGLIPLWICHKKIRQLEIQNKF
ncbi:MAG: hypothetical protein M3R27_00400 [Bacteroidota bacterium]|nr:hypothetical protein [Bacteroidota bacterium]